MFLKDLPKNDVVDVMEVRTVLPTVDKDISEKNALNTSSAVDETFSKSSEIEAVRRRRRR